MTHAGYSLQLGINRRRQQGECGQQVEPCAPFVVVQPPGWLGGWNKLTLQLIQTNNLKLQLQEMESGGRSSSRLFSSNGIDSARCLGYSRESPWAPSSRTRAPASSCSGRATSIGRSSTRACSRTAPSAVLWRYFPRGRSGGFQTGSRARTWRSGWSRRPQAVNSSAAASGSPKGHGPKNTSRRRRSNMTERNKGLITAILWALAAAYAVALVANIAFGLGIPIAVVLLISVAFALIHGAIRYGWSGIVAFVLICLVGNTLLENPSILTD